MVFHSPFFPILHSKLIMDSPYSPKSPPNSKNIQFTPNSPQPLPRMIVSPLTINLSERVEVSTDTDDPPHEEFLAAFNRELADLRSEIILIYIIIR